jgi:type IV pilus assembly protein PilN
MTGGVNLLPHREWARHQQRQRWHRHLWLAMACGGVLAALLYGFQSLLLEGQVQRNRFMASELSALEQRLLALRSVQEALGVWRQRQEALEGLQAQRLGAVWLLQATVDTLPQGVYLSSLQQTDEAVALRGITPSQEAVFEYVRRLARYPAPGAAGPQLLELTAHGGGEGVERLYRFSLRIPLGVSTPHGPALLP